MPNPIESREVVYEANMLLHGGVRLWGAMIRELAEHRELVWRLAVRDILVRYKQSFLGIFWAFLTPLVLLAIFLWIKNNHIVPIRDTAIPYPAFLFLGQMTWLLFAQGITAATNSLANAGSLLTKINFPRETLVFASLGQSILDFLIRIPLLLVIFWWQDFAPHPMILAIPLLLLPLVLLMLGIGFFLALLNALFRDVGNLIGVALNLGMFATTVIYPPPRRGLAAFAINHLNPVSAYINALRDWVSSGTVSDRPALVSAILLSLVLFLAGWRLFHLLEPKIAERA